MLGRVIGEHWHALARDVLALGYRSSDILTTLDLGDMVSIVVASPPTSSVRYFIDGGWSRTDHLLANIQEREAGLVNLQEPYQRPGAQAAAVGNPDQLFRGDAFTWAEFDELERKRAARAAELAEKGITLPNARVRTL